MFAYYFLESQENQQLYREIADSITAYKNQISSYGTGITDINKVIKAVLVDNPQIFWFEGKWEYKSMNGKGIIIPQYLFHTSEIEKIKGKVDTCVGKLKYLKKESPYNRAQAVFEWIIDNVEYGMSETKGQNLYDALVRKKAVCKGLAKAYQFLLDKLGVFSTLEEGTIDGISKHVWNIIEIESHYYNVDVTMGYDRFSYLFGEKDKQNKYRCFAISDNQLWKTHRLINPDTPHLPCNQRLMICLADHAGK